MNVLDTLSAEQLRTDLPEFRAGDTIRVEVKVREGDKERVQLFQGVVIQRSGHGVGATITVRKISQGIGVERIFPLHSPLVDSVNVVKQGSVRRSKLYYLRGLSGRKARIKERK